MEVINTEILISSLFRAGFDKVDSLLFTFTLAKISINNCKNKLFQFKDRELGILFNKYVDSKNFVFKLKDGYTLTTRIKVNNYVVPLAMALNTNSLLVDYLNNLDFSEIILKKARFLGIKNTLEIDEDRFSHKEIEILKQLMLDKQNVKVKKNNIIYY